MSKSEPYFERFVTELFDEIEGGYVDDPADRGGATNLGISLRFALDLGDFDWDGRPDLDLDGDWDVDEDDIRLIDRETATPIYHRHFWNACACELYSPAVALVVFDAAVNQGAPVARRILQRSLRVRADGIIGNKTLAAYGRAEQRWLLGRLISKRALHYSKCRTFDSHGAGWFNRLGKIAVRAVALSIESEGP